MDIAKAFQLTGALVVILVSLMDLFYSPFDNFFARGKRLFWGKLALILGILGLLTVIFDWLWPTIFPKW
jgi:hypothetical protein